MQSSAHNPVLGFTLSLTTAALWGMLPVALKELVVGMDAATIVWFRFIVAGGALWLWLTWSGKRPVMWHPESRVRWFLLIATVGLCINYVLFSYSLNFINAETTEAVIQLTTLFLIFGGVLIYHEPFLRIQKIGTALIALGLLLFFHDRLAALVSLENRETIGVLVVVGAAINWTVYALLQKELLKHYSSVQILMLIYFIGAVLLVLFASPSTLWQLSSFQVGLLVFACLNTIVGYGCFAESLHVWEASKVSAVLALAPFFAIGSLKLIVWLYPDYPNSDRLTLISILGAVLLVIGSVLTALMPEIRQALRRRRTVGES